MIPKIILIVTFARARRQKQIKETTSLTFFYKSNLEINNHLSRITHETHNNF
jgi:hypothetical protein